MGSANTPVSAQWLIGEALSVIVSGGDAARVAR
jgi:hypothetical protein